MQGYQRQDGRKGIRNVILVAYLVECAHHVAREITYSFRNSDVQLIGFPGCYRNDYSHRVMEALTTHPNVGGVLLLSLGCEGFRKSALLDVIAASGRPVELLTIQETGGTAKTVAAGLAWVAETLANLQHQQMVDIGFEDLIVGTICGGSDGTSGLTGNPAVGRAFDKMTTAGAACIFEETGELIGCEHHMAARAVTPELGQEIIASVAKAATYYRTMGQSSFAPGNADGGLTTIEEKSMGAYAKSGAAEIVGLLKPGDVPPSGGLYLLDVVSDGEPRFGFPNISDTAEIVELMACGAQVIIFTTGRGSVVGSAISPVIKVCANPDTYERMADDMDVNAGRIMRGDASLEQVGDEIHDLVAALATGVRSKSEALGHQEFYLGYKSFEPIGPSCLPRAG